MHVRATQNLLAAATKAGVRRFLHMSALGCGSEAITRYHRTKWEAQEAVSKSELAYTIFRPSVIFGLEDKFINLLADMVRRLPALPRFGQGRIQPVWVEDVAACFAHALRDDATRGRAFDLCGPEVFTLDELMNLLCRKLGKHRRRLGIPPWLMRMGAALMELLPNPPVTREQMAMLGEANTCSSNNIGEVFGISPRKLEDYLNERLGAPVA
jgi:NADH dehydrogenase